MQGLCWEKIMYVRACSSRSSTVGSVEPWRNYLWFELQLCFPFLYICICVGTASSCLSWEHDKGRRLRLGRIWQFNSWRCEIKVILLHTPFHNLLCVCMCAALWFSSNSFTPSSTCVQCLPEHSSFPPMSNSSTCFLRSNHRYREWVLAWPISLVCQSLFFFLLDLESR